MPHLMPVSPYRDRSRAPSCKASTGCQSKAQCVVYWLGQVPSIDCTLHRQASAHLQATTTALLPKVHCLASHRLLGSITTGRCNNGFCSRQSAEVQHRRAVNSRNQVKHLMLVHNPVCAYAGYTPQQFSECDQLCSKSMENGPIKNNDRTQAVDLTCDCRHRMPFE